METLPKSKRPTLANSRRLVVGKSMSSTAAKLTVVAILSLSATALAGRASEAVSIVIFERIDEMDQMATAMKAISNQINSKKDLVEVKKQAASIRETAESLPALFPEGSGEGRTDAKPEIWSDRPGFEAKTTEFLLQAKKLEQVAAGDDAAGILSQFHVVEKVCSDCHEVFRAKKTSLAH
jgi:cytochrome c556